MKPIRFTTDMVAAILAGRKTQTRRPVTPHPAGNWGGGANLRVLADRCHYGRPGNRMRVAGTGIELEITDVRVERVQEISDDDCRAEGVTIPRGDEWPRSRCRRRAYFADLWDSMYGGTEHGWGRNPLVWVIEFKVAKEAG